MDGHQKNYCWLLLMIAIEFCLIGEFNVSLTTATTTQQSTNPNSNHQLVIKSNITTTASTSIISTNCSYSFEDVYCDCDPGAQQLNCYNIESAEDLLFAFNHLLNTTGRYYWLELTVHCIQPFDTLTKTFHLTPDIFTNGPKFQRLNFLGDCSKPKHYDNLLAQVDRDVDRLLMTGNSLRITTTCSLFQIKFERLGELVIKESLMAGDMISATFSTKCLGQYGTRNEALPLARLSIIGCNITLIESGAFNNFAELQSIDLSHNQLTHLSRHVFSGHLYKLRSLRLASNRLQTLGADFFDKLPQLRQIDLSGNQLATLPYISSIGSPQVILLADNPWDCRCKLTWIANDLTDKLDNKRYFDEPLCQTPDTVNGWPLMDGLKYVDQTFC
ncbi:leucine-rich alpha-2-glycoprotein-like [Oppia nitens]|uniref:leucine-rich alpha-2-glycoprotein-like n=1 Tax=Oppia nitens TaxID=1686743 RepID=UPI0023DC77F4|nr:leucine-rich alpha-2-glycoprotein-like [Oppia nitens]